MDIQLTANQSTAPTPIVAAPTTVLQVASASNPSSVAGAIAGMIRERGAAEAQAIGAGAINQTVKAIAIARGYLAPSGLDLICIPAFVDVTINGEARTAIRFFIEPRRH